MIGFMYILKCSDGSYYTGSTKNLELRLHQHQIGEGANHTKKRLPVELVYYEVFDRIDKAFYREKQIQGWSIKKKEALIKNNTVDLHYLSICRNETHFSKMINTGAFDSAQAPGDDSAQAPGDDSAQAPSNDSAQEASFDSAQVPGTETWKLSGADIRKLSGAETRKMSGAETRWLSGAETMVLQGNSDLLYLPKTAFFCSRKIPASVVLKCFDWAIEQRESSNCVIGPFHSPIEKDVLHFLLKGNQAIIIVLARSMKENIDAEFTKAIDDGRLLIISPFDTNIKRVSQHTASIRNKLIVEMADNITIAYSSSGGQLEKLISTIDKPINRIVV